MDTQSAWLREPSLPSVRAQARSCSPAARTEPGAPQDRRRLKRLCLTRRPRLRQHADALAAAVLAAAALAAAALAAAAAVAAAAALDLSRHSERVGAARGA